MKLSLRTLLTSRRARLARAFRQESADGIAAAERNWSAASRWSRVVERVLADEGWPLVAIDVALCAEHFEVVE